MPINRPHKICRSCGYVTYTLEKIYCPLCGKKGIWKDEKKQSET